jgi:ComF family protein
VVRLLGALVDFLVDDACQVCGRGHRDAPRPRAPLDPVRSALTAPVRVGPVHNHPLCPDCAGSLAVAGDGSVIGRLIPGGALLTRSRELLAGFRVPAAALGPIALASAFRTDATLLTLIHRLKFSAVPSLAEALGRALAVAVGAVTVRRLEDPLLVPVPMDVRSRRRRGFNQAELLARVLAREWRVQVAPDAVVKPAPTSPQSLARASERLGNVRNAYRAGPTSVAGRNVVVVDDLVTTGATAVVVTAVLGAAGAASVRVASVGRAL